MQILGLLDTRSASLRARPLHHLVRSAVRSAPQLPPCSGQARAPDQDAAQIKLGGKEGPPLGCTCTSRHAGCPKAGDTPPLQSPTHLPIEFPA